LPALNLKLGYRQHTGEDSDYKGEIADEVTALLENLEKTGGKGAFEQIKSTIPLCELLQPRGDLERDAH
jgi:hypothetical protein